MPFEIVRNDITNLHVDAIVNSANPRPVIGYGLDAGIHRKAGPGLLEARQKIGRIGVGEAAVTPGFDLKARYVIHAVGPVWRGGFLGEARLLRSCYDSALALAREYGCESVAFPMISTGNYGFPKDQALQIALSAFRQFLAQYEMRIILVVFDRDSFRLSETLTRSVSSFIDENYVLEKNLQQYGLEVRDGMPAPRQEMLIRAQRRRRNVLWEEEHRETAPCPPMECAPAEALSGSGGLARLLQQTDAGFSETLLKLIDQTGKKDSEIYARANISRQHFSKIRHNPDYQPTKATAIAFTIALELDLAQTQDLIGRAGYVLTTSSKFDVIIMYFIREGNYNLFDINAALFSFDQSLLGGK